MKQTQEFMDTLLSFRGRARRMQFLGAQLVAFLVLVACTLFARSAGIELLLWLGYVAAGVMLLSSSSCRLHDLGHSGFLCLILLVPFLGTLLLLYLLFAAGEPGANAYGPAPR